MTSEPENKVTTAEIIVDRRPRVSPLFHDADLNAVVVAYDEKALRKKLKSPADDGTRKRNYGRSGSVQFGVTPH